MKQKPKFIISPSMLYSLKECDGLVLSKYSGISLKPENMEYLQKGTDVHFILENKESEDPIIRDISEKIISKDKTIKRMLNKVALKRFYTNNILANESILINSGKKLNLDVSLFDNRFIIEGTIDAIAVDHKYKRILVIDYKTSFNEADKDITQLKCYIYKIYKNWDDFCKKVEESINIDVSSYKVIGYVDYINPDVNLCNRVIFNRTDIDEFEVDMCNEFCKFTKIFEKLEAGKKPERLQYKSGTHCKMCAFIGNCSVYKDAYNLSVSILKEPALDKKLILKEKKYWVEKIPVIKKQIKDRQDLLKLMEVRQKSVYRSGYLREYIDPIAKKDETIDLDLLTENLNHEPDTLQKISKYLKISITKENTKQLSTKEINILKASTVTKKIINDGERNKPIRKSSK